MKKTVTLSILAALAMSTTVFASPVELDGKYDLHYRYNTGTAAGVKTDAEGAKGTFILNAKTNVAENLDVYARFAAQSVTAVGVGNDFVGWDGNKKTVADLDQFGFNYANKGFNYKVGRQDASVGATAILYSTGGYLGKYIFADGVTVTGKTGVTDIKALALQESRYGTINDNKLYAISGSYSPAKNWTLGATVAKYDYAAAATKDTNHYALNAGYDMGKASLFGEYAKSDASAKNKAYAIGTNYAFDSKNSAYVINFEVQDAADMNPGMTDFDNGYKGFYYGFNHQVSKDATLKFLLINRNDIDAPSTKVTSFRTTMSVKF